MDNQPWMPCSRSTAQAFSLRKDKAGALQNRFFFTSYPVHSTRSSQKHKDAQSQRHRLCPPPAPGSLLEKSSGGNATGNQGRNVLQTTMAATKS